MVQIVLKLTKDCIGPPKSTFINEIESGVRFEVSDIKGLGQLAWELKDMAGNSYLVAV